MTAYASSGHLRVGSKTNGVDVYRVTTAPNTGGGLAADLASLACDNTTGIVYVKFGAADTDWSPLGPAQYTPNELWARNNVAASLVDQALNCSVSQNFDTWRAPRAGSVVALVARFNGAITAGSAVVTMTKNGVVLGTFDLTLTVGTDEDQVVQAPGIDTYVAGDLLGMAISTSVDFAPNTIHLEAFPQVQDA